MAFIEDNLLTTSSGITHHGEIPDVDKELSPSLENFVVLTWLRLLHPSLPRLVKQRYGIESRSGTLASVKPEISQANQRFYTLLPWQIIAHLFPLDTGHCGLSLELSSPVLFASRLAAQIFGHISSAVASFCLSLIVSSCPRFAKWPALNKRRAVMITSTLLIRLALQIFKNSRICSTVPPESYLLWNLLPLVA